MNRGIYFTKKVWALFKNEPEKSKLINKLLEEYYGVSND